MSEPGQVIPQEWVEDFIDSDAGEALNDAFHAEFRKQYAFSVEHYGKVALATYPFLKLVIAAVAPLIRADERERCAKIAWDDNGLAPGGNMDFGPNVALRIASAIRGQPDAPR